MVLPSDLQDQVLITISVVCGAFALVLTCVAIGTPNWQTNSMNTTSGDLRIVRTASFFFACRLDLAGEVLGCGERATNRSIAQYYRINATGNEEIWNYHLDMAGGFAILGIIFILIGILATMLMLFGDRAEWIYLVAPSFYFLACLFMMVGLAEGSRVLLGNGYSANVYEAAHAVTIFSFLVSSIVGGRLFKPPDRSEQSRRTRPR